MNQVKQSKQKLISLQSILSKTSTYSSNDRVAKDDVFHSEDILSLTNEIQKTIHSCKLFMYLYQSIFARLSNICTCL